MSSPIERLPIRKGCFFSFEIRKWTFGEVEGQAEALAASLSNLGVEAGDRVAVVLPGCPEFAVAFFALAKLGAVLVPLSPRLTETELQYMLRHSESVCAVTIEDFPGVDFLQLFEELFPRSRTCSTSSRWGGGPLVRRSDLPVRGPGLGRGRTALRSVGGGSGLKTFAIVYTSGTTGKPKGVELTHESGLMLRGKTDLEAVALGPSDRVIGVTAIFHVFGLGPGLLGCALSGASLVLQEEFAAGRGVGSGCAAPVPPSTTGYRRCSRPSCGAAPRGVEICLFASGGTGGRGTHA
jgi:acyl-CoA synthetase (AMP-forming)/AMP-acid ligase II